MSQLNLHGKTKADLTVIAQVAGLLTASEARKMTKKQLLDYLLQEEDKIAQESADKEADAAAESGQATDITVTPEAASLDISAVKVESEIPAKETDAKTADKKEVKPSVRKSKDIDSKEKTSPAKEKVPAKKDKTSPAKEKVPAKKDKTSPAKEKVPAKKGPSAAGKDEVSAEKDQPVAAKDEVPAKKDKAAVAKNEVSTEKDKTAAAKDEVSAEKDQPAAAKEKSSSAKDKASSAKDASSPDSKGSKRTRSMKSTGKKTAELSEAKAKDEQELDVDVNDFSEKPSTETSPQVLYGGVLEIMQDNYGFLRRENYLQSSNDIYVPPQYIRRFNLRTGDYVVGPVRKQRDDRYQALYYVKEVNGLPPDQVIKRPHFDRLTPVYPNERYVLETSRQELSTRIIDLVAPIGKGQRGMIVSPPKAGKTIILQKIAKAIATNNPEAKLIVLLIDERPEEVTDMQRSIDGEVVYSTFDKTPENHVKVTELVLERAMRLVEMGQDVVILLDSITRMGRAYNLTITPTGRTLSGGLDPGALYGPKRFFGAARNIENGGSLTIIATALIETGSRMDEVIFEEFKGTGNMEVLLDRKLSEKRIFPAIDITRSSTRREELLLSPKELDAVWGIRKAFGSLDTSAVTETIISLLMKTRDNEQFISSINISFNDKSLYESMRGNIKPNGKKNDGI